MFPNVLYLTLFSMVNAFLVHWATVHYVPMKIHVLYALQDSSYGMDNVFQHVQQITQRLMENVHTLQQNQLAQTLLAHHVWNLNTYLRTRHVSHALPAVRPADPPHRALHALPPGCS